jgi:hypothetical protein
MIPQERDNSSSLRVPEYFEQGAGSGDGHPALHESQILENQFWRQRRAMRVAAHVERVQEHLRRHSRRRPGEATQGKRQATWCVEMKMRFDSLTDAGKFVNRPPSNILQAIHSRNRCGNYHWEYFDPARHPDSAGVSPSSKCLTQRLASA